MTRFTISVLVCFLGGWASMQAKKPPAAHAKGEKQIELGNFSVSLTVKDLAASRAFYEKLGFHDKHPLQKSMAYGKRWLVLQNETATIGLFQGMFEKNSLTFNPGWDRNSKTLPDFDDVREIQKRLKSQGLTLTTSADESTTDPASLSLLDPDGNPILIDQHVPKPGK